MAAAVPTIPLTRLTPEGCRQRADAVAALLRRLSLDAALLTEPRYVNWLTGHWRPGRSMIFMVGVLVEASGRVTLLTPVRPDDGSFAVVSADETTVYESFRNSLVAEDQPAALIAALGDRISALRRVGMDQPFHRGTLPPGVEHVADLRDDLVRLRRTKHADEVAMIRTAIAVGETAFARARDLIRPGLDEVELYGEMLSAAVRAAGEPLYEFGNDFQFNAFASLPRRRAARAGEMVALDVTVSVRGYTCDLCRTFVAGGEASAEQMHAHATVVECLEELERSIRPGVSCGQTFARVHARLDGYRGWKFFHHLGHGVGMWSIERPRINEGSNDILEPGDVFAIEPALYDAEVLGSGVRVEDNYLVTAGGVERLSGFPRDLYCGAGEGGAGA